MQARFGALILLAACGSSGAVAPYSHDAGAGNDAPLDAAMTLDGAMPGEDGAASDATETGGSSESGALCGALGESCCAAPSSCVASLTCVDGKCACAQSSDCPGGGVCTDHRCTITLASGQTGPYEIAVDRESVYFDNTGYMDPSGQGPVPTLPMTIAKAPLDGGATTTLYETNQFGLSGPPTGLVVDARNVYWAWVAEVMSVPLAGGAASTVASYPTGFAGGEDRIALASGSIYWTQTWTGNLVVVPATGGTPRTLAQIGDTGVAADSSHVYWSAMTTGLVKGAPDGGAATTLAAGASAVDIAVDSSNVYWSDGRSVQAVPIVGGTPTTLATGLVDVERIAADGTSVYWADHGARSIGKIARGGGTVTTISTGDEPWGVAVDSTSLYWTVPSDGTVMRLTPK